MIFIHDIITSKILEKHIFPNNIEGIFVKLNFRKCKWLLTIHHQNNEYFFNNLDKALDTYSKYGKTLFAGDFNTETQEQHRK